MSFRSPRGRARREPVTPPAEEPTAAVDEVRDRAVRLLDFLLDVHALRYPPIRDITAHQMFLLREEEVPAGPGVSVAGGGDGPWLRSQLVPRPPQPTVPTALRGIVGESLSPNVAPDLSELDDTEPLKPAAVEWVEQVWRPWSEVWAQVERSRGFFQKLFDARAEIERDRATLELLWGFWNVTWHHPSGPTLSHPLLVVPIEIVYDDAAAQLAVSPTGPPVLDLDFVADLPVADRSSLVELKESVEVCERRSKAGARAGRKRSSTGEPMCEAPEWLNPDSAAADIGISTATVVERSEVIAF